MGDQYKTIPNLECLKYHGTPQKPDIKIFVSHRIDLSSETISNPVYIPVRCGAVFDKRSNVTVIGDDTGDNISYKRMSFCELTVQYWAWKNVRADYFGLCHYRRYLNCSNEQYLADTFGNVLETQLNSYTMEKYGLSNGRIKELCQGQDIILPIVQDVSGYPDGYKSVWSQYSEADQLQEKDLCIVLDVIEELYPDYLISAKSYLYDTKAYVCNLFVMKSEIFFEYCEWLFSILDEFCRRSDMSGYSAEGLRTPGHIAERLLGIFVTHQRRTKKDLRIKELQPVVFFNTERDCNNKGKETLPQFPLIEKAYSENNIAIVLSSSDLYAPYAVTLIQSIIDYSSPQFHYDILYIESGISKDNKRIIETIEKPSNISIRIISIKLEQMLHPAKDSDYISIETYFRLLFPYLLSEYEKIIWLDSDTLVQTDVAELFKKDIDGYLIAATQDYNAAALRNGMDPEYGLFCKEILGLESIDKYFQAGVLIINLDEFRKTYALEEIISLVGQKVYPYADQDILNKICRGKVLWLENCWNVVADVDNCLSNVLSYWAPAGVFDSYQEAKLAPKILHFAGPTKPWHSPKNFMADRFWATCRKTPFYEIALAQMIDDMHKGILRYGMDPTAQGIIQVPALTKPPLLKRALLCVSENGLRYTIAKILSLLKNKIRTVYNA